MAKTLELKIIAGTAAGRVITIPPTGVTIGRHPPAEVILKDPSISRQHCSIYPRRDHWVIEDLSSQNGTLVNGVAVTKYTLQPGDKIQVGEAVLRVPRDLRKALILGGAAAAGLLLVILLVRWAGAAPGQPAPAQDSASAATGTAENTADSELTDAELVHPRLKRPLR
jgi:hypothetical protein